MVKRRRDQSSGSHLEAMPCALPTLTLLLHGFRCIKCSWHAFNGVEGGFRSSRGVGDSRPCCLRFLWRSGWRRSSVSGAPELVIRALIHELSFPIVCPLFSARCFESSGPMVTSDAQPELPSSRAAVYEHPRVSLWLAHGACRKFRTINCPLSLPFNSAELNGEDTPLLEVEDSSELFCLSCSPLWIFWRILGVRKFWFLNSYTPITSASQSSLDRYLLWWDRGSEVRLYRESCHRGANGSLSRQLELWVDS